MKTTNITVCDDCVQYIANGELGELAEERIKAVIDGVIRLGGHVSVTGETNEFSWVRCDCCLTNLGGSRTGAVVLTNDFQEEEPCLKK